jgi:CheY-like chemotaxis protein
MIGSSGRRFSRNDLILSDLRMPDLDGPGFYREAERQHPGLGRRFVFLTGDVWNATIGRFLEETGVPSLSKPFTLADIRQALQPGFSSRGPGAP